MTTLISWRAAMYFPAPCGLYYLLGRGACSGLASSAPNVCDICTYFFVTNVSGSIFSFSFSGLKLSQPVFFIEIAALRAYLDDVSLDFVVMLRHAYPFSSSFHVLLLSAQNFRHIDRIWCTICSPCPHKSHAPLVLNPGDTLRFAFR